tara:strand:+ start:1546 stop:1815 length:270 start_codon:yes stop_codon:yes gene_type:complete
MDEELRLAKENDKGVRAEVLLKDEIFREAIDTLKKTYTEEMFKTKFSEEQKRLSLLVHFNTLESIEKHIKDVINTGKLANEQLKQLKKI